ncbi:MAG: aminotransferase class IV [Bacteroidales bacterium]|nr:aminotransferase class IV [Bacteroidales bacterium]MDD3891598.1 aminotransferase class IV [Bacteroidales bacterium]
MIFFFDKEEEFFIQNNQVSQVPKSKSFEIPDNSTIFYEVIRVINGIPLFLDEHVDRLEKSTLLSGITIDVDQLVKNIIELVKRNPVKEKNLKISLYCDQANRHKYQIVVYFIESSYPLASIYQNGVRAELIPLERKNPNVKLENPVLRHSADKVICLSQTHEALLVNDEGFITEGSRSNFFAVINNTLVTPPSKDVLEGVTRKMVIALAKQNSIPFQERPIHKRELDSFDGVFITGTSPKVLPIAQIGNHNFKIPKLTQEMIKHYDELVNKNLIELSAKYINRS